MNRRVRAIPPVLGGIPWTQREDAGDLKSGVHGGDADDCIGYGAIAPILSAVVAYCAEIARAIALNHIPTQ